MKAKKIHLRYGKFSFRAYSNWTIFLVIAFSILLMQKKVVFAHAIAVLAIMALFCVFTHYEWYQINNNSIEVKRLFSQKSVSLPSDLILIIAKTTVLSWPLKRLRDLRNTIHFDDRFMVCIIGNATVQETIKIMHRTNLKKDVRFSNEVVKELFRTNTYSDFLYSFVYEPDQLQKLIENHNCQIILPKSLKNKVNLDHIKIPIYLDEEG